MIVSLCVIHMFKANFESLQRKLWLLSIFELSIMSKENHIWSHAALQCVTTELQFLIFFWQLTLFKHAVRAAQKYI